MHLKTSNFFWREFACRCKTGRPLSLLYASFFPSGFQNVQVGATSPNGAFSGEELCIVELREGESRPKGCAQSLEEKGQIVWAWVPGKSVEVRI